MLNNHHTSQSLNIETDLALLLTASIDIKGMPRATPTVPEQRQEDYFNALSYYVNNHPQVRKIIFVENSGWNLDRVKEATRENPHNKEVDFVSLDCNDFPREYGKGYGECLLIDKGIAASELAQSVNYIAKITGRIYLLNLTQLLRSVRDPYDCYCDYKDHGWRIRRLWGETGVGPHCDTRFLVFSLDFYRQHLQKLHRQHPGGGFCIEAEVYNAMKEAEAQEKIISRFPLEPDYRGVAGHFQGKDYDSPKERAKFVVRSWSRRVVPWAHL
ncbi:MAG: hypothetical protein ACFB4I_15760 [Cyanophyceae cyanobacterium]